MHFQAKLKKKDLAWPPLETNAEAKAEAEVEAKSVFFDQSSLESHRRQVPPLTFKRRLIRGPGLNS